MEKPKGIKRTCSRGHIFYKSSDCPVCPKCGDGDYREDYGGDLPGRLSAPAFRALVNEGIRTLTKLSGYTEKEVLRLHGMGKASLPLLREALAEKGLTFKIH